MKEVATASRLNAVMYDPTPGSSWSALSGSTASPTCSAPSREYPKMAAFQSRNITSGMEVPAAMLTAIFLRSPSRLLQMVGTMLW